MIFNKRRVFLKSSFLTTAVILFSGSKLFGAISPLETLSLVQEDLFPHAKEIGIKSAEYLLLILDHSRITDEEKAFIRNGVQWLNEESLARFKKIYTKLSPAQRQEMLETISTENWGARWIESMLTYILEATLGDPIYGANTKGAGWKWLHHTSGFPRPTKAYL
ncbi:MAG: gluconate 2-dehydrogenase subunit 3 family protein [Epsilonproteobacteria bacterium]|nr:gluconate 2-dehydrogenase subunit 3 family protein [Campylobacterota bacterium]NCO26661.1 gluconate 2-dehydrogenase subunit 3 family protein [Campylobacterota bacterium]NCO30174.1 gluconate 2-dehydrogenase subunit 3 family protein [Campylobacterota bacterium]NCS69999.1 gluconate 2-dehydrogenase subunit 3 family protein [Campylobacterota bacterium]OIO13486.1 MAG: hypothetical protein AUJ81_11280 [Helicobacteraceae bacterium CG1_02_36_14]